MHPIPFNLRTRLSRDPYYATCARQQDGGCHGRITWEHALLYAGRQVQEEFAIIPLCEWHHLREGLNKAENIRIAMSRATQEDRKKYPRLNWR